ncbi:MAG: ATP-dependent helicase DeaD [Thermoplasmata archaeon]|jgi:ATP-dependent RNA helicase DeaD|nr:ATP-dependent helicase DeaD [Thermoplasmata archaeon]
MAAPHFGSSMARDDEEATFDDLPLSERAREAVHRLGWRAPTPIQRLAVPQLAMGRDVIGRAQTGSGKTAAFGLVLTDQVKAPGVQALVLAPTRELVVQIARDLNALAEGAPFRAVPVYGGVPYDEQIAALADPATTCIVATTGRLLDLLARRQVLLDQVRFVVLDEADRMLDLGFLPEVERVLKLIPGGRQTALFTATMPRKVALLAHQYMAHPREVEVGPQTPLTAEHYRVDVASTHRHAALAALLAKEKPARCLVFVRTREGAAKLARELVEQGVLATPLHGDLTQPQRERVVASLREGRTALVVATDVAARGLDFPAISHVVNFEVPEEADQYVHRAGRTARAGREGRVFTLVTENDGRALEAVQRAAKVALQPYALSFLSAQGDVVDTATTPLTPPKMEMPGGNARGARRRAKPTPPNPLSKLVEEPEPEPEAKGPENDLPPSRRERRRT